MQPDVPQGLNPMFCIACNGTAEQAAEKCVIATAHFSRIRFFFVLRPVFSLRRLLFASARHTSPRVLHRHRQEPLHTSQVQGGRGQLKHPFHPSSSTQLHLPQTGGLFQPPEHLLHSFALLLTPHEPRIVSFLRPQPVRPLLRFHGILRHVGNHPPLP